MKKQSYLIIGLLLCLLNFNILHAKRFALVVGNGKYNAAKQLHEKPNLKNAKNDAVLVAKTFRSLGFETILIEDGTLQQLYAGLERLKKEGAGAALGVVYFAGHGMEVDGTNYLLPVGAKLTNKASARTQTLPLDAVLRDLDSAKIQAKMVILDCCRNNPFAQGRDWEMSRNNRPGLAVIDRMPPSTLIMYSAGPGQTASDGRGVNSPFTEVFSQVIQKPNISCFEAFFRVADHVKKKTFARQQPWVKFDGAADAFRKFTFKGNAPTTIDANTGVVQMSQQDYKNMQEEINRLKQESQALQNSGSKPTTSTSALAKNKLRESEVSLSVFLRSWFNNQESNSAYAWASDFAPSTKYCYWEGSGPAPLAYIVGDRKKLIEKYPNRQYSVLGKATAEWFDNYNRAVLIVSYHYEYSGVKRARGNSFITLGVKKVDNQWKIISYDENVRKNAFKPGETPPPTAKIAAITKPELDKFLTQFIQHNISNDANLWVQDFAPAVAYVYKKDGLASHAELRKGRAELIKKFPNRNYKVVSASYSGMQPTQVNASLTLDYDYGRVKGRTKLDLKVILQNGKIVIKSYNESIVKK